MSCSHDLVQGRVFKGFALPCAQRFFETTRKKRLPDLLRVSSPANQLRVAFSMRDTGIAHRGHRVRKAFKAVKRP
jgi:hypothetical protein